MAEKEINIRDAGYAGIIKYILADFLKEKAGIGVFVEPQPITCLLYTSPSPRDS